MAGFFIYMPGLFGIVSFDQKVDRILFSKLAEKISPHEKGFSQFENSKTSLGFKSLDIVDPTNQPFHDEENDLTLFFWGEIFSHPFGKKSEAEIIFDIHLNDKFSNLRDVNGFYSYALWDNRKNSLILASDIYATRPLYYYQAGKSLIFASSPFAIANTLGHTRINTESMGQFLTTGMIIGDGSWIEDVRKLRYSHYLCFDSNGLKVRQYFRPAIRPADISISEAAETLCEKSKTIADRMTRGKTAISLSGGSDSRFVAQSCKASGRDLPAFTFGGSHSADIEISKIVCKKLGIKHYPLQISTDYLKNGLYTGVYNTGGYTSAINFHGISTRDDVKRFADICLTGLWGNNFLGYLSLGMYKMPWLRAQRKMNRRMVGWLNSGFAFDELNELFKSNIQALMIRVSLEKIIEQYRQNSLFETFMFFDHFEAGSQNSLSGSWLENDRLEFRALFLDYDLLKFNLALPPRYKLHMRLGREIWRRHFPEMGNIIHQRTGRSISASLPMIFFKKLTDKLMKIPQPPGIMDYSLIFRTDLSMWLREFLLSKNSLNSEYLNYESVKSTIADHQSGIRDNTNKIGLLLTFEQTLRIIHNR
jgi:asparagine synthetase B (glutamine-hydrolysing)